MKEKPAPGPRNSLVDRITDALTQTALSVSAGSAPLRNKLSNLA